MIRTHRTLAAALLLTAAACGEDATTRTAPAAAPQARATAPATPAVRATARHAAIGVDATAVAADGT
ncbi:MAG: hypothetical protein K8W52_11570, partial [Deltaproteobacteria bacterium]|nr:hypothetical protein [Deltaproteobacteria bacterium]